MDVRSEVGPEVLLTSGLNRRIRLMFLELLFVCLSLILAFFHHPHSSLALDHPASILAKALHTHCILLHTAMEEYRSASLIETDDDLASPTADGGRSGGATFLTSFGSKAFSVISFLRLSAPLQPAGCLNQSQLKAYAYLVLGLALGQSVCLSIGKSPISENDC